MPNLRGKTWTTSTPANVEDAQYWEDHLISDTAALKAASSVQSVNSITPDAQGNVDIVALPDGGTAGQVLTKQSSVDGDADWEDPASSGHTIEDEDGNTMPYQSTLQFENAEVTNDSVNNKTIVDCKGSKGDAATITVGTVTTLPAGSDATVTNSGTSSDAVFDFGIPKGADGAGAVDSVNGYTGVVVLDASDVGALPDSTTIPTKTSELDNDSGFVTSSAIPTSLSELSDDATHRLVTDAEKNAWDAKVSESLLKSTVGWVGRNELPITLDMLKAGNTGGTWSGNTYTQNGVVFTVTTNDEGYVTEIDTYTATSASANTSFQLTENKYIPNDFVGYNATGCSDGTTNYFFNINYSMNGTTWESQVNQTTTAVEIANKPYIKLAIFVGSGETVNHKKSYPMFAKKEYANLPFAPYHLSVEQCKFDRAEQRILGAKNIADESNIEAGRAWNGDTNSARARWIIPIEDSYEYIASISGTNSTSYIGYITSPTVIPSAQSLITVSDFPVKVTPNSGDKYVIFGFNKTSIAKSDVEALKFMLRLASDPDDTYQPYAMTNRELTEKVGGITVKKFTSESFTVAANSYETKTFDITNGGLHALGIVGHSANGTGNDNISFWREEILSDTQARIGVENTHASASSTITADIYVLYIG